MSAHPPPLDEVDAAGATQRPVPFEVSHTEPFAQSAVVAHAVLQLPSLPQRNGAQGCGTPASPAGIDDVRSGEQLAAGFVAHLPAMHTNDAAQSVSAVHDVAHVEPSEQPKFPGHGVGAWQAPALSQTARLPSAQPVPHDLPMLGYAHAAMFVPSH